MWQITHLGHLSQIAFHALREKRCLGLPNDLFDYPPGVDKDSHHPDRVNFFRPWVFILVIKPNIVEDVHVQQLPPTSSSDLLPLLFLGGLELKENICVDGWWHIECCPPKYVIQCFALPKSTMLKCKVNINLYKSVSGILFHVIQVFGLNFTSDCTNFVPMI
jgi:hypothetical protein